MDATFCAGNEIDHVSNTNLPLFSDRHEALRDVPHTLDLGENANPWS